MKKLVRRTLRWGGGCLLALPLALLLLSFHTQPAAAQSLEQQHPMTGTMLMTDTMPMSGTIPMSGEDMAGGNMDHMMQMMAAMDARMARMEAMMQSMHGSMPMNGQDTMSGMSGMGGMMGQGGLTGEGGAGGQGGTGGMMGQGMMGQGMMGQSGMMGDHDMHMMLMDMMMLMYMQHMMEHMGMNHMGMMGQGGMMDQGGMMGQGDMNGEEDMMCSDGAMCEDNMPGQDDMSGHDMGAASPMTDTMGAAAPASGASADERSGEVGGIQLRVTPANLTAPAGDTLNFTVDLEAQDASLDFDLTESALLMVGSEEVAASGWTVNFDHGHHVNGTLSFPRADVEPLLAGGGTLMLHIGAPTGSGQAMFSWDVDE